MRSAQPHFRIKPCKSAQQLSQGLLWPEGGGASPSTVSLFRMLVPASLWLFSLFPLAFVRTDGLGHLFLEDISQIAL